MRQKVSEMKVWEVDEITVPLRLIRDSGLTITDATMLVVYDKLYELNKYPRSLHLPIGYATVSDSLPEGRKFVRQRVLKLEEMGWLAVDHFNHVKILDCWYDLKREGEPITLMEKAKGDNMFTPQASIDLVNIGNFKIIFAIRDIVHRHGECNFYLLSRKLSRTGRGLGKMEETLLKGTLQKLKEKEYINYNG